MKTTRILVTAALLVASASVSFAGPGAQYWQQRRNPPATAQKTADQTASQTKTDSKSGDQPPANGCKDCGSCKAKN